MKKNSLIAVLLLIMAGVSFFTSCTTEEENLSPNISFVSGSGYISSDATLKAGEAFTVNLSASANSTSGAKLVKLNVIRVLGGNTVTVADETIDLSSFTSEVSANAAFIAGTEKWTFTVTDANGETAAISLNITTTAGAAINTFDQKILGSYYNNTYGSFFGSADGTVYKMVEAYNNQAKVDWCYYYGVSDGATIAAPNDATAINDIFTNATYGLSQWTTRNATLFSLVTESILWTILPTMPRLLHTQAAPPIPALNSLPLAALLLLKLQAENLALSGLPILQPEAPEALPITLKCSNNPADFI